ncbi:MAG: winged helix-turn-helix domain-containing protein [Nitrososphaerales archaeon]
MQHPHSYSSSMAAVLRISSGDGAAKIRIMRETSLSFKETTTFLFLLKANGMLNEETVGKRHSVFRTTAKGTCFISTLESLQ